MPADDTVHATCLVLHEAGLLIRGGSGNGKTSLALALLDRAASQGFHAGLIADDRTRLEQRHGRLIARGHPAVAGLIEIRGHGIRRAATTHAAAVIRLVIDLVAERTRSPEPTCETATILGVRLPCLIFGRSHLEGGSALRIVFDELAGQAGCVAAQTHPSVLAPRRTRDP